MIAATFRSVGLDAVNHRPFLCQLALDKKSEKRYTHIVPAQRRKCGEYGGGYGCARDLLPASVLQTFATDVTTIFMALIDAVRYASLFQFLGI